jgi:acyl-CoA hydrolase
VVTVYASINDVGTTSVEVGVRVEAENIRTGEVRHTSSAYLVFVALDDEGNPTHVPPVVVTTEAEARRQAHAKIRRETRKARQEAIKRTMDPGFDPDSP